MNKHKVKHHRNSDTKTSNRDHIRTTVMSNNMFSYTILSYLISNNKIPRFLFRILLFCSSFAFINSDLWKSQLHRCVTMMKKRLNSSKVPNTHFLCFKWEQIIAKLQQQKTKKKKTFKNLLKQGGRVPNPTYSNQLHVREIYSLISRVFSKK